MDQQLMSFVTVADCRSFTKAAEVLHTTQPAVSQNIQNLERRLNVKLLERSNKFVGLNKAGEVVYHYAKEILHLYGQMTRMVGDLINEPSGPLTIGSSLTFGEYVLPHALSKFLQHFPDIRPSISIENTRDVVEHVASGLLDVGIIEGTHDNEDVEVVDFADDTVMIVACADHPLSKVNRSDVASIVEQLSQETWIVREPGSGTREVTESTLSKYNIRPSNLMEFGSLQVIKESVEAGLGVTVLSKWVIRKELALGTLTPIEVGEEPTRRNFSVVLKKSDFRTKSTQLFADFLRDQAAAFMNLA